MISNNLDYIISQFYKYIVKAREKESNKLVQHLENVMTL